MIILRLFPINIPLKSKFLLLWMQCLVLSHLRYYIVLFSFSAPSPVGGVSVLLVRCFAHMSGDAHLSHLRAKQSKAGESFAHLVGWVDRELHGRWSGWAISSGDSRVWDQAG